MEKDSVIPVLIFSAFLIILVIVMARCNSECSDRGGVLVQGAFGFECVEKR